LAEKQCIKRHDRLYAQLHFPIYKEIGVKLRKEHWYEHIPKSLETSHEIEVTILLNARHPDVLLVTIKTINDSQNTKVLL